MKTIFLIGCCLCLVGFSVELPKTSDCAKGLQRLTESFHRSGYQVQRTLKNPVVFVGVGVHSGAPSSARVEPAAANSGIVFEPAGGSPFLASHRFVTDTRRATQLSPPGATEANKQNVKMVEHLLSALYGLGITNARIHYSGEELPILDGSTLPYAEGILSAGTEDQNAPTRFIRIKHPIHIQGPDHAAAFVLPNEPGEITETFSSRIDFSHPLVGNQNYLLRLTPSAYISEVAPARTFGFASEASALKESNRSGGSTLENTLVFNDQSVVNLGGMRLDHEPVRHKLADAIGDFSLFGYRLQGHFYTIRGGHSLNYQLLKQLDQHPLDWEFVDGGF